jgi:excisionase family DNA binding protein
MSNDELRAERLLYRVEEAAEVLGVCRTTMYRLIREREVRSVKIGDSRRVPGSALAEYVDCLLNEAA